MSSPEQQLESLKRAAAEVIPEKELLAKLGEKRPLRAKFGVDPTGPDLHLGHCVVLRKLRQFQDLGHTAVLIIGDFTAMIGDPSGRSDTRRQLTREEVERNMATYKEQAFRILDPQRTEFRCNSEWLGSLKTEQILRLCASHTVAQMLAREEFAGRYESGEPIGVHEFMYPLLQGYDSIAVRADVELGGTEQKFNLLVGRELQRTNPLGPAQPPQVCLTMPILVGTDGVQRMGKSLDNYIPVNTTPDDLYGKVMSIGDHLIAQYFSLLTDTPQEEIERMEKAMALGQPRPSKPLCPKGRGPGPSAKALPSQREGQSLSAQGLQRRRMNPRDAKMRLAREITAWLHGEKEAEKAEASFQQLFSGKEVERGALLQAAKRVVFPAARRGERVWISRLLFEAGLVRSVSEGRRAVEQGGAWVDEQRITDPEQEVELRRGLLVRVGKRRAAVIEFQ
jgi:tyrosyl-tRNA synthetase